MIHSERSDTSWRNTYQSVQSNDDSARLSYYFGCYVEQVYKKYAVSSKKYQNALNFSANFFDDFCLDLMPLKDINSFFKSDLKIYLTSFKINQLLHDLYCWKYIIPGCSSPANINVTRQNGTFHFEDNTNGDSFSAKLAPKSPNTFNIRVEWNKKTIINRLEEITTRSEFADWFYSGTFSHLDRVLPSDYPISNQPPEIVANISSIYCPNAQTIKEHCENLKSIGLDLGTYTQSKDEFSSFFNEVLKALDDPKSAEVIKSWLSDSWINRLFSEFYVEDITINTLQSKSTFSKWIFCMIVNELTIVNDDLPEDKRFFIPNFEWYWRVGRQSFSEGIENNKCDFKSFTNSMVYSLCGSCLSLEEFSLVALLWHAKLVDMQHSDNYDKSYISLVEKIFRLALELSAERAKFHTH